MTLLIFSFPKLTFLLLHSSLIAFLLLTLPQVGITVDFHFLYNLHRSLDVLLISTLHIILEVVISNFIVIFLMAIELYVSALQDI